MAGVVLQKSMQKYEQTKTCAKCGFTERRFIDKKVAAFERTREWKSPCVKCQNTVFESSSSSIPPPDTELLDIWCKSNDLMFLDQDEDILLAEPENFDLLTEFVNNESISREKREILLSAICVLLYDNTPEDDNDSEEYNIEVADKVRHFLISNKQLFKDLDNFYISEYIKELVYPQIGMR